MEAMMRLTPEVGASSYGTSKVSSSCLNRVSFRAKQTPLKGFSELNSGLCKQTRISAQKPQQRRPGTLQRVNAESTKAAEVPLNSEVGVSYELLREKLAAGQWEEADNETRRLLCVLAGEGAEKRKWVYFSEVQFIPTTDLQTIDSLWRAHSNNRFGYTVQKRLWLSERKLWKPFFLRIGWTYGENSTYKKFPMEFLWDITAPEGHLPLTNALRGTQLFEKLLNHPAFDQKIEDVGPSKVGSTRKASDVSKRDSNVLDELFKY